MSNEDKALPINKIKVEGKEYNLTFSFGFLRRLHRLSKLNPFSPTFLADMGPSQIHAILWTLLIEKRPTITDIQVDEIIDNMDSDELNEFGEAVTRAALRSQAQERKSKKKIASKSQK